MPERVMLRGLAWYDYANGELGPPTCRMRVRAEPTESTEDDGFRLVLSDDELEARDA